MKNFNDLIIAEKHKKTPPMPQPKQRQHAGFEIEIKSRDENGHIQRIAIIPRNE